MATERVTRTAEGAAVKPPPVIAPPVGSLRGPRTGPAGHALQRIDERLAAIEQQTQRLQWISWLSAAVAACALLSSGVIVVLGLAVGMALQNDLKATQQALADESAKVSQLTARQRQGDKALADHAHEDPLPGPEAPPEVANEPRVDNSIRHVLTVRNPDGSWAFEVDTTRVEDPAGELLQWYLSQNVGDGSSLDPGLDWLQSGADRLEASVTDHQGGQWQISGRRSAEGLARIEAVLSAPPQHGPGWDGQRGFPDPPGLGEHLDPFPRAPLRAPRQERPPRGPI